MILLPNLKTVGSLFSIDFTVSQNFLELVLQAANFCLKYLCLPNCLSVFVLDLLKELSDTWIFQVALHHKGHALNTSKGQNLLILTAPPAGSRMRTFNDAALFHQDAQNFCCTNNIPRCTKSLLESYPIANRKSAILMCNFSPFMAFHRVHTLTNSSNRISRIDFKFMLCNLEALTIKSGAIWVFVRGVLSKTDDPPWSSHNSSLHAQIWSKLYMLDKSPALYTTTCKYSLNVIVPPTGKWK